MRIGRRAESGRECCHILGDVTMIMLLMGEVPIWGTEQGRRVKVVLNMLGCH